MTGFGTQHGTSAAAVIGRRLPAAGGIAMLLLVLCMPDPAWATDIQDAGPKASRAERRVPAAQRRRPARDAAAGQPVTAEQEEAIRAFVKEHHPQLATVLDHLEANRPKQYQRALIDLNRHRERISQWRARDPQRYELEVKLWTLQSRAQLLAARLSMTSQQELEDELREVVSEQFALRLEILRREHDRIAQRKTRLEQQIQQMEENRDEAIERQLKALSQRRTSSGPREPALNP